MVLMNARTRYIFVLFYSHEIMRFKLLFFFFTSERKISFLKELKMVGSTEGMLSKCVCIKHFIDKTGSSPVFETPPPMTSNCWQESSLYVSMSRVKQGHPLSVGASTAHRERESERDLDRLYMQ